MIPINSIQDLDEFDECMNEKVDQQYVLQLEKGWIQMAIISEPIEFYLKSTKPRNKSSKVYFSYFITIYLTAHTIRLMWCLTLPDNNENLVNFGDFTQWFGGKRIYFLIPIILININASIQSLIYLIASEKDLVWLNMFASLQGIVAPSQVGLWRRKMFSDLYSEIKTITRVTKFLNYFAWFTSIFTISLIYYINHKYSYFTTNGFFWVINHIFWFFYMIGIPGTNILYFQIICSYLYIRLEAVNKLLIKSADRILYKKNNWRSSLANISFAEHDRIRSNISDYNKFWKKFISSTFIICLPLHIFIVYQLIFIPMNFFAFLLMFSLFLYLFYTLFVVGLSAALIPETFQKPKHQLNSVNIFSLSIPRRNELQRIIERISGSVIGFSFLNLFSLTRNTIYGILAFFGINFLLLWVLSQTSITRLINNSNTDTSV